MLMQATTYGDHQSRCRYSVKQDNFFNSGILDLDTWLKPQVLVVITSHFQYQSLSPVIKQDYLYAMFIRFCLQIELLADYCH
jgi:hypothetical protein